MSTTALTQFVQFFALADNEAAQRLTERLALVLADSAAYQAQYAEELAERGMDGPLPAQELRDVALIDALLNENLLWESDYQDPAAETAAGLNDILEQQQRPERLQLPVAGKGPEALDALQEALEPLALALVLLTLDSDAYPLSLIADEQAEAGRRLAVELGFNVTIY